MQQFPKWSFRLLLLFTVGFMALAFTRYQQPPVKFLMPYKQAGLTDRQAAAHLIDRFTFGYTPGLIDTVLKKGLEKWFLDQLDGKLSDEALNERLAGYNALQLSNAQIVEQFPDPGIIAKEAAAAGIVNKEDKAEDKKAYRAKLKAFMEEKGYQPQYELLRQFAGQKIWSAAYSKNQLHQVLTEFWFNHFNISATKNQSAPFIPNYERDVIRPRVAGKFGDLLLATAQSPAMLFYLDNFSSMGENVKKEQQEIRTQRRIVRLGTQGLELKPNNIESKLNGEQGAVKQNRGLNENYAREIMELHTLGVDGGYTQEDVTQAARVLTGWTIYPFSKGPGSNMRGMIERMGEEKLKALGYIHKGDFLFAINRHDGKEKRVLGKIYPEGGGFEEGLDLIDRLARHPSTAKFICTKLATRFVSDQPSKELIAKMAIVFSETDGDIKEVLKVIVSSKEFWSKESLQQKTKSPFEYAVAAVRAVDADVKMPYLLYQWIAKMGQKLYFYQAPTGFPDKGQYWINTGSLLNRMNFGLAFAAQKIPGVSFDLAALNQHHEPGSTAEALATYCKLLLPERHHEATIKRLMPLINDPAFEQKIREAADKNLQSDEEKMKGSGVPFMNEQLADQMVNEEKLAQRTLRKNSGGNVNSTPLVAGNNSVLAQVVGIIIGSPEFQKR